MESSIFKRCTFYIEKRGKQYKDQLFALVEIIKENGGYMNPDPSSQKVTHILIFADDQVEPNMTVELTRLLQRPNRKTLADLESSNTWSQDDLINWFARRTDQDEGRIKGKKVIRQEWIGECIKRGGTGLGRDFGGWEVCVVPESHILVQGEPLSLPSQPRPEPYYIPAPPPPSPRHPYKPFPVPPHFTGIANPAIIERPSPATKGLQAPAYDPTTDPRRPKPPTRPGPTPTPPAVVSASPTDHGVPQSDNEGDLLPCINPLHTEDRPMTPPLPISRSLPTQEENRVDTSAGTAVQSSGLCNSQTVSPTDVTSHVNSPLLVIIPAVSAAPTSEPSVALLPDPATPEAPNSPPTPPPHVDIPPAVNGILAASPISSNGALDSRISSNTAIDKPVYKNLVEAERARMAVENAGGKSDSSKVPPHVSKSAEREARQLRDAKRLKRLLQSSREYVSTASNDDGAHRSKQIPEYALLEPSITAGSSLRIPDKHGTAMVDLRTPLAPSRAENSPQSVTEAIPRLKLKFSSQPSKVPVRGAIAAQLSAHISTSVFPTRTELSEGQNVESPNNAPASPLNTSLPLSSDHSPDAIESSTPDTDARSSTEEPILADIMPIVDPSQEPQGEQVENSENSAAPAVEICIPDTPDSDLSNALASPAISVTDLDSYMPVERHSSPARTSTTEDLSASERRKAASRSRTPIVIDSDSDTDDDFEILERPAFTSSDMASPSRSNTDGRYSAYESASPLLNASASGSRHTSPHPRNPYIERLPSEAAVTQSEPLHTATPRRSDTPPVETDHLEEVIIPDPDISITGDKRKRRETLDPSDSRRNGRSEKTTSTKRTVTTAKRKLPRKRRIIAKEAMKRTNGQVSHLPSPATSPLSQPVSQLDDDVACALMAEEPVQTPANLGGIFVNPSGIPIRFHFLSPASRALAKLLLAPTGGLITDIDHAHMVVLDLLPGSIGAASLQHLADRDEYRMSLVDKIMISYTYIADCVEKEEMLHCEPYRVRIEN